MNSGNAERLWLQDTLNQVAVTRAAEAIQQLGQALPCRVVAVSGSIVTVAFELTSPWTLPQITIPKLESAWIRSPTQVGDLGMTVPADVYLGGISGLGGGTADATRRGNLSTLAWLPVSNNGSPPINQTQAQIQGPNGVILQTSDGNVRFDLTETGITFTVNGLTWSWGAAGLTMSNGVIIEVHTHTQEADSHGDTEEPVGPPINP